MRPEGHQLIATDLVSADWTRGSRGMAGRIRRKALRITIAAPMIVPAAAVASSAASRREKGEERGCGEAVPQDWSETRHSVLPRPTEAMRCAGDLWGNVAHEHVSSNAHPSVRR